MQTLSDEQYLQKEFHFSKAVKNPYANTIPSKQNCVYKFMDANNKVIYIGKCKNLKARFNSHKNEPHLAKKCYSEVRQIQYISYPSYMDAGVMERIFIAHYQPKYNVQFAKEGVQSIISPEQLDSVEWSFLADYPDGFQLNESNKRKRMGVLDKADFILFDGEGITGEGYFYKIIKQNHKPKVLKIVGCLVHIFEDSYEFKSDPEILEEYIQDERKKCEHFTTFPMRFIRQSEWEELKDYYNFQLKMPIIYKGDTAFHYGKERIPFRYHREHELNYEFDIPVLAILGALEILTTNGEIDSSSVFGKPISITEDFSNISLTKILNSKQ